MLYKKVLYSKMFGYSSINEYCTKKAGDLELLGGASSSGASVVSSEGLLVRFRTSFL